MLTDPIAHWEIRPLPADQFDRLIRLLLDPAEADADFEAVAA